MINWFISKCLFYITSIFNTTHTANSTKELAFLIYVKNTIQRHTRKAIAPVLVAGAMLTANEASGQNSATIDPKYYSISNPYEVPNLPNGSTMNLVIKTGASVKSIISGADVWSLRLWTPDGRTLLNVSDFDIYKPGVRWLTWKENWAERSIAMIVNYQADIYGPNWDRPDAVFVDPGETTRLSGGPNFNPNNETTKWYTWKDVITWISIWNGQTDSAKNVSRGTYRLRANDGTTRTADTISVIERPVADHIEGKAKFAYTVPEVIYKIYKGTETWNDTVWTQDPSLWFVGNGNARTVNTWWGNIKIGAIRRAGSDVVEAVDKVSLKIAFETKIDEVSVNIPSFTINNWLIRRYENVEYYIYDINGKIIVSGNDMYCQIKLPGVYIIRHTEKFQIKTHKILISP